MKHKLTFICEEHREHGTNGFRSVDQPGHDPLAGMGVAHDCLEHFPGGTDAIHDEFQAHGAIIWVRGVGGWLARIHNFGPIANPIARDFPDVIRHVVEEDFPFLNAPRTAAFHPALKEAIEQWERYVRRTWEQNFGYKDEDGVPLDEQWITNAKRWMIFGFNRARRRFEDPMRATVLFLDIERKMNNILAHCELGTKVQISWDDRDTRADIKEIEEYFPEDDE